MTEKEAIDEAYSNTIQQLYKVLLQKFTEAGGDKKKEAAAETAFRTGVTLARRVRDRALAVLPS